MIYTSYISKLSKIPNDYYKLIIARHNKVDSKKFTNCCHVVCLSPNEELLSDWKSEKITCEEYYKRFMDQIYHDKNAIEVLKKIREYDRRDMNVVLLCYEKDIELCHRYIIAKMLEKSGVRVGYEL